VIYVEKFLNLPVEKQKKIIDAALMSFGANGYKKTSISDIATAAGISKAMVFHYFGSKKELYYYLINYSGDIIVREVSEIYDIGITDFFERIRVGTEVKMSVLKKHPGILSFIYSVYMEREEEVQGGIKIMLSKGEAYRKKVAFDNMDTSKFKADVDPQLVLKMLTVIGEGFANNMNAGMDMDEVSREFEKYLQLLKENLYKEEYL
jgi:AcrR family transcriptional regulator